MKTVSAERIAAALLAILLLAAVPFSVYADTDWQTPWTAVLEHISGTAPSFGFVNGEWRVFALSRSGRMSVNGNAASGYYGRIEEYVSGVGSGTLNPNKASENSRLVIALSSIGRDPRNVAGFDVLAPLTEQSFVKRQGPTGVAYALLALGARSSYGESAARNAYVEFLLNAELSGGGWSLGSDPDPDVTAIVITALAPYSSAASAINRGVSILSGIQRADGKFETMGTVTSESCSQVVTALSTVGIDCDRDARFIKNGNSALYALTSFFTGEGFAHIENGTVNEMASEQAAYALAAYYRFKSGRNDLYDMNDVQAYSQPTPKPTSTPTPTPAPTPTAAPTAAPTIAPTQTDAPSQSSAPTDSPEPMQTELPADTAEPDPGETDTPDGTQAPSETPEGAETQEPSNTETASEGPASANETEKASEVPDTVSAAPDNTEAPSDQPKKTGRWILPAIVVGGSAVIAAGVFILINRRKK